MKKAKRFIAGIGCVSAFTALILLRNDVLGGAIAGIELCLYTVIPSLFPFIFLSIISVILLQGGTLPLFARLNKLCGIPSGGESLFITGLLGGYPTGAQGVYLAYQGGNLSKESAEHLLSFCNNAGPAFIFGILGRIFSDFKIPLVIWLIQIFSAIISGFLLNNIRNRNYISAKERKLSITEALQNAVTAMAKICGWIILFKIVINTIQSHVLYLLPQSTSILIIGFIELSNGCILLGNLEPVYAFYLANFLLAFGGICVWLQTLSFTRGLRVMSFFRGKCLQAVLSVLLSLCAAPFLFPVRIDFALCALCCLILVIFAKIVVAFQKKMLYNKEKTRRS